MIMRLTSASGRRPALPVIDALCRLHGHGHLLFEGVAQDGFGTRVHKVEIGDGRGHLGPQAFLFLALEVLLQADEGIPVFRVGCP
jgi:hypothetical protein